MTEGAADAAAPDAEPAAPVAQVPESGPSAGPTTPDPASPEPATTDSTPPTRTTRTTRTARTTRRASVYSQLERKVAAIRAGDDAQVESVILSLSQRSRFLAPLTLVVGAFAMLFQGVKLLFTNWRLTLIQVLPAMLIWMAMLDLKLHVLKGKSLRVIEGPILMRIQPGPSRRSTGHTPLHLGHRGLKHRFRSLQV
jgi:hypothetical protein